MSANSFAFASSADEEPVQRGQQLGVDLVQRGQVHRGGEDVVRGLAHVHVVVAVDRVAGDVGDHLVGVHVRRGPGPRLEDVHGELVVVAALRHLVTGGGDLVGDLVVQLAQVGVGPSRGGLQPAQPVDHRGRDGMSGDLEVLDGLGRLAAPELVSHARQAT
jgi:hypothetical protein